MTPPAVAPAPESDYELMLPEGVTVEALRASLAEPPAAVPPEEAPEPSPAVAPAPAPAPAPVAAAPAPAVAPAPAPARPGVVRDLQKERGRRQNAAVTVREYFMLSYSPVDSLEARWSKLSAAAVRQVLFSW